MIILMNTILNMLDLWLGVIDISIREKVKKEGQGINAYSIMVCSKSMG